jgi:DNA-binding Lrp family transcriptional regulator
MPFAQPVNPYVEYDPKESFVTVRECAEVLNMSEERVRELAKRGMLRSRGMLVQPALIPGYTA